MNCLVYTPICPHSLFNRSVIFGADSHLAVNIPENIGKLYLSVDGETPLEVSTGDQLRFFAADRCARFIRLGAHDFTTSSTRKSSKPGNRAEFAPIYPKKRHCQKGMVPPMKTRRHAKILELIKEHDIDTQDELLRYLRESGFDVTQATVSRDIKELRLVKTLSRAGKYRYSTGSENISDMSPSSTPSLGTPSFR